MNIFKRLVCSLAAALAATVVLNADDGRLKDAATTLSEMLVGGDDGISPTFIAKAKCLVVVPGVKKAALGFGGQYGRGYISCRNSRRRDGAPGGVRIAGRTSACRSVPRNGRDSARHERRGTQRLLAGRFTVERRGHCGRSGSRQASARRMRR
jgi:hypothetical protein